MNERIKQINEFIGVINGIQVVKPFEIDPNNVFITGSIIIEESGVKLSFDVSIFPQYPFQYQGVETIKFINTNLMEYSHVMGDGSVCIHTSHNPDLKEKLYLDFNSLKEWIKKYYVNKESDNHYEHLIVPLNQYKGTNFHFLFTDVDHQFKKGDFGVFKFGMLADGIHFDIPEITVVVQEFLNGSKKIPCSWSINYLKLISGDGIYVYLETPPTQNGRFVINKWSDLESFVNQSFMLFLHNTQKRMSPSNNKTPFPLLIGYKIPDGEVHWQCAAIDLNDIPNYAEKISATKTYEGRFYDTPINWLQTKNCSYKYFFGRGALNEKLTDSKILIIGIGAVGSILATTLTRGGCKNIALADYDIKEPENVCRSEYFFVTGVTSKVKDLQQNLIQISPFVQIEMFESLTNGIKGFINSGLYNEEMKMALEKYDFIFDCSADNDLAYILDNMHLKSDIINLSITNYANELVCVVKPDLYKWMNDIFNSFDKKKEDLYNPTGCWSPTFKASYNDIAIMVQNAVKQINYIFQNGTQLRNFYLQIENNDSVNIKLHKF